MKHIPRILNCAAVRLFAVLNNAAPASSKLLEPVRKNSSDITQLAICQKYDNYGYDLLYCDRYWQTRHAQHYSSLEEAINDVEKDYPGTARKWLDPVTASKLSHTEGFQFRCAFCEARYESTEDLIVEEHACICYSCLDRLYHQSRRCDLGYRFVPPAQVRKNVR